jgi:hypothetical protein
MLNGTYTAAPYPVIIVAVSRLLRGYSRLIRISKKAQTKEVLCRIFFSMLRIKISIPIMEPVVICSFAMINAKPSLRFPFPNLPSTALRSPSQSPMLILQKAHNYAVFRGSFSFFGSNLVIIVPVLLSNYQ